MSKHKKSKTPSKAPQRKMSTESTINPEFKKEAEAQYGSVSDFSDMPDEMKLSAKMIELVEPFNNDGLPVSVLYDCATLAWNACNKEDFEAKTDYVLNNMLMDFARYRDLIDALKKRKRLLFSHDTRGIKKVGIFDKGNDEISINVVSDWDMMAALRATLERLSQ